MRLTTRGRYGARFMLDLAMHYDDGPVILKELAERQKLSAKYLDQLVSGLRKAGLVKTKRGVSGGFKLARRPEQIRLLEVIEAVEGPINVVHCVAHPAGCPRSQKCGTMEVWEEVAGAIRNVLSNVTLSDLVKRQKAKELAAKNDPT
jgi:Rrf2 family cysteine metabolism transcriptional repressor